MGKLTLKLSEQFFNEWMSSHKLRTLLMVVSIVIGLAAAPFAYAVDCGDVLGPGGFFRLQHDLTCDTEITVVGPAVFDLSGHTITSSPVDCTLIRVEGQNAKVRNGNLENCGRCLVVGGDGAHRISRMNLRVGGASDGMIVQSDRNRIVGNKVTEADFAFYVSGQGNLLLWNAADINFGDGFVVQGTHQWLIRNTAIGNVASGFIVAGSHHKLIRNEVIGTQLTLPAFQLSGDHSVLIHNSATSNSGDGFSIDGRNHRLIGNAAEANGGSGIAVAATDSKMVHNTARDNGDGTMTFDLFDRNPDCDNNTWRRSVFGTRNQDCIR